MREHSAVGIYILRSPSLLVFDHELIKQVLISKFRNFRNNDVAYQASFANKFYRIPH